MPTTPLNRIKGKRLRLIQRKPFRKYKAVDKERVWFEVKFIVEPNELNFAHS